MPTKRILVTGVSRDLGARFARALAADDDNVVLGVDVTPPRHDLGRCSFVRADIRNPTIGKVIAAHAVDTVVHMAIVATPRSAGGRSSMKEINVIGTMQLLAACQKADTFRKLVVQSSVSVYGASYRDPARFTEDLQPRVPPRTGFGKDSVEVESYVRGLARRRPDVVVTTLRLANLMGAGVDSNVTRYLSLPVVPRVMGFDARLQFLHPSDAVDALLLVTRDDVAGTYNVAASDLVTLSQALGVLGRPERRGARTRSPRWWRPGSARPGSSDFSADQIDALTYGRGMDTSRFTAATGFTPRYTSRAALAGVRRQRAARAAQPGPGRRGPGGGRPAPGRRRPDRCRGSPWLTPRSSSSAAAVPPAGAAEPARRPPRAGWPPSPPPGVRGRPEPGPDTAHRSCRRGSRARSARSRGTSAPRPPRHRRSPARAGAADALAGRSDRSELVQTLQGAIDGSEPAVLRAAARSSPATRWHTVAGLAGRLGVEWPWSVEETVRLRPVAADRRLRGRRVRLRPRVHHQDLPAAAAAAGAVLVPGRGTRRGEPADLAARRCWSPTTPAPCRWTG